MPGHQSGLPDSSGYSISYSFGTPTAVKVVKSFTIAQLFASYGKILWEEGKHKGNVKSFLGEINEIFLNHAFSTIGLDTLDHLIGTLRERGNSNATINRKMAALSKLLRKACKMGDIYSLPEFRRLRTERLLSGALWPFLAPSRRS